MKRFLRFIKALLKPVVGILSLLLVMGALFIIFWLVSTGLGWLVNAIGLGQWMGKEDQTTVGMLHLMILFYGGLVIWGLIGFGKWVAKTWRQTR